MMRRGCAAMLVLLSVLLTGCAELPSSGPVEQVKMVLEQPGVEIAPEPPAVDMSPEQLIDGFLLAMADPDADYAIAREYLTGQAEKDWQPSSGATIYDGGLVGVPPTLDGRQVGTLDRQGRYAPEAGTMHHDFGLIQVDGQWRIDAPPEGLLLSRFLFERYYSRVTTYFMSRQGTHVVPDVFYLPESLVTPQRVVETQLAGPSPELAPAVTNALGPGVRMGPEGATINAEGVVMVDLAGLPAGMPEEALRRLGAQLLWSLTAVPRTTGLRLTVDGVPFDLPGQRSDGVLELSSQQGYQVLNRATTPDLYAIIQGVLGVVTSTRELAPLSEGLPDAAELAISIDATLAAIVNDDGRTLLLGTPKGRFTPVEHDYQNLRCPQFVLGELWVLADDPSGAPVVLVVSAQGDVSAMAVDLPSGHRLRSMTVSQTGATAATITVKDGTPQLGMMTIAGGDVRLATHWRQVRPVSPTGQPLTGIEAADWQGETSLAVLAAAGGAQSIFLVQADGSGVEDLSPPVVEVDRLTALIRRGGGGIAIRTVDGMVWRYESITRWSRAIEEAEVIAYAG
ncbi:MAG TPA: LpqB family beta-propeller domain-containing protein [Arachnia sp.]|mgnify:CR=1 FL=1|nr:LpqB family beta-propeller domain-containing protein [Arachnia sp.]HMT86834.1 LpqB family beta-propeller domain-containing protein [Arachnia sp.]